MKNIIKIFVFIFFIALVFVGVKFFKFKKDNVNPAADKIVNSDDSKSEVGASWVIYNNKEIGFSLYYPKGLIFAENAFWDKEDYKNFKNPKMTDHFYSPEFVFFVSNGETIDQFIAKNHDINSLPEVKKREVVIGKNKFIEEDGKYYIPVGKEIIGFASDSNKELLKNVLTTFEAIK